MRDSPAVSHDILEFLARVLAEWSGLETPESTDCSHGVNSHDIANLRRVRDGAR